MIWLQRNVRTFNRQLLTVPELTNKVLEEADTWISAGVHSLVLLGQQAVGHQFFHDVT
jgi:hypothetical protein